MIVDYFLVRHQILHVDELYSEKGRYWFNNGFNPLAVIALIAGILPNIPGFLTTTKILDAGTVPPFINGLYHWAWFVGFAISGLVYWGLSRAKAA